MADNYRVNVVNDKREVFDATIDLIYLNYHKSYKGVCSFIIKDGCLIFSGGWNGKNGKFTPDKGSIEFPFEVSKDCIKQFAWEWLQNVEYPEQLDQDGTNKKGFWINTSHSTKEDELDIWSGQAGNVGLGIFMVKPVWCMYGK